MLTHFDEELLATKQDLLNRRVGEFPWEESARRRGDDDPQGTGLTLDSGYLDVRAAREPSQAYVAVSHVRTLAGLVFNDLFKAVHVSKEAIRFYREAA
jgi:hypothetical protein